MTTNNLRPQAIDALINRALLIDDEEAKDSGSLAFMARSMVQATLPHRAVAGNEFERKNGAFTLTMLASSKIGLPYGSIPRLLLAWVTTEAVKNKCRELELGESMSAFMSALGLTPTGGENGSIRRLKEQARRLFNTTILATYEDGGGGTQDIGYRLADKTVLWWPKGPEQNDVWMSSVTLSEAFFREIIDRPVPIDMRAMTALKHSPLALDIYTWLTYRTSYLKAPTVIPWQSLAFQMGSDYSRLRAFKEAFAGELRKVMLVYSGVRAEVLDDGLKLGPCLTHIPMGGGGRGKLSTTHVDNKSYPR